MIESTSPSRLFKYRDDSPRTEKIITEGKVWLSTPDQLNDPLECRTGQIPPEWKEARIREMEDGQLTGFVMSALPALEERRSFYSLSYREAKQWFNRFKQLKSHEGKYASMRSLLKRHGHELSQPAKLFDTFERQLTRVGVFSLSECPDNQLMWAHYAASHTGLSIGFKRIAGNKLDSADSLLRVTYEDTKPVFASGHINQVTMRIGDNGRVTSEQQIGFSDPTFRAALATKPVAWSYEREWRYVEETGGLFPWPGPIDALVFGLRMPNSRRTFYSHLIATATADPVDLFEIVRSEEHTTLTMIPWRSIE